MLQDFVVTKALDINAPVSKVWNFITTPEGIKEYLFGTNAISEWKVGSLIRFVGVYEGKSYEDRGTIEVFDEEKVFEYTYYSSFSGVPDQAENYTVVRMELEPTEEGTRLKVKHSNFPTETAYQNNEKQWDIVLDIIKDKTEERN
ncbi:ATPase [Chitinophaga sp. SYP-B3965]|uniref:SRPBCC family protein n=1 Tax=Chitinophaga sp. SYP-B3965 TaxID=2663120 RepID=UPI001299C2AB|nr:SRPBCC family protein [Chitinophaga sp. SYP-B3965]MRG44830.1 ATPase [Chitinophaga sp. SYP-B3965]